ncbi:hypothetical protein J6590_017265 [Homalodisca vitripennis]|nr:hypothetical protein J6590_017265 [Homalodisca vitripennis]
MTCKAYEIACEGTVETASGSKVLQSPWIAFDLVSLDRSVSSQVAGLAKGQGHLKKRLRRFAILLKHRRRKLLRHPLLECPEISRSNVPSLVVGTWVTNFPRGI